MRTVALLLLCVVSSMAEDLSNGWHEKVEWHTFKDGLVKAKEENKPMMLILWTPWCDACKTLKKTVPLIAEIGELSSEFIMVNEKGGATHGAKKFNIDGGYFPRIIYLDANGEVRSDITAPAANPKHKYFYSTARMVSAGMKMALQKFNREKRVAEMAAAATEGHEEL